MESREAAAGVTERLPPLRGSSLPQLLTYRMAPLRGSITSILISSVPGYEYADS
jgi:hypothetical protein